MMRRSGLAVETGEHEEGFEWTKHVYWWSVFFGGRRGCLGLSCSCVGVRVVYFFIPAGEGCVLDIDAAFVEVHLSPLSYALAQWRDFEWNQARASEEFSVGGLGIRRLCRMGWRAADDRSSGTCGVH